MTSSATRFAAAMGVMLAFAAGCSSPMEPVSSQELVGTWRESCGGQLTLAEDGTITATEVHDVRIKDNDLVPVLLSGSGTWYLDEFESEQRLDVGFDEPKVGIELTFEREDGHLQLIHILDPDNLGRCTFTRE